MPLLHRMARCVLVAIVAVCALAVLGCRGPETRYRTFQTPDDAARALLVAVKAGKIDEVVAIFGPGGQELIDSSDPTTARQNREVFLAAATERWRIVDGESNAKVLVVGNEEWPFPVPLVRESSGWRFNVEAAKEEIIARRIGRNELSAIQACKTYVAAQTLYAQRAHDGKRAGLYAAVFRSDAGKENGLYWPAGRDQKRSPLGDLVADAADPRGQANAAPQPFHGYYFKILTAQGSAAPGGARSYIVDGDLSGGHALVAWPAHYDVTGVMTFLVGDDGVVREKDLGAETDAEARRVTVYNPDATWKSVQ